jgi:hypothetical protein
LPSSTTLLGVIRRFPCAETVLQKNKKNPEKAAIINEKYPCLMVGIFLPEIIVFSKDIL